MGARKVKNIVKARRTASESGYHYINLFQNCKRKFYIRHVLRYVPQETAGPLVFGGAFHEAKAVFYETKSGKKAEETLVRELKKREKEIDHGLFEQYTWRGPVMLGAWISRFGMQDVQNFKVLHVEEELRPRLPNGFEMTMRPDCILQNRSGTVYIMETKTSFSNPNIVLEGVVIGDQSTAYIYGVKKVYGIHAQMIPDIVGWSLSSMDTGKIACFRGEIVERTEKDLEEFEAGVQSELLDISTRVAGIKKYGVPALFPRNTQFCMSYNRRCEYADICRGDLSEVPALFKKEEPFTGRPAKKGKR